MQKSMQSPATAARPAAPARLPACGIPRTAPAPGRRCVAPRALGALLADIAPQVATTASQVASQATLAPGSVDAPAWVIPVAALVVTVAGGASAILLKPGADAAEEIFERDARTRPNLIKRAKANMKFQQTIRGGKNTR